MSLPGLDLRHLRYFIAVVEQRTFQRCCAAALHVSQPPLTRQIRQLEEALKVQLLLREVRMARSRLPAEAGVLRRSAQPADAGGTSRRTHPARRPRSPAPPGRGGLWICSAGRHSADRSSRFREKRTRRSNWYSTAVWTEQARSRHCASGAFRVGFNRFFTSEPGLSWEVIQTERMYVVVP